MGFCGDDVIEMPPPADTSGMEAILASNAEFGQHLAGSQLEFAKQQWSEQKAMMQDVLDVQIPLMQDQLEWSRADRDRWETVFKPMEDDFIKEAQEWASPEKMELEAGRAQADVTKAFEMQRQNSLRKLEGYGIDPSQTRWQALDTQVRAQQAATQAAAGNMARRYVEDRGLQLQQAAIGLGRGLPMQAVQTGASASNIGQQAISGYNQTLQTQNQTRGLAGDFLGTSTQAASAAGNLVNAGYQNQLAGWQAQADYQNQQTQNLWGGLGTMAGIAALFAEGGKAGAVKAAIGDETLEARGFALGGEVDGPGGPKDDLIPAALSDDEYVIPAEVVKYKGTEFFDKVINKSRETLGVPPEKLTMQAGVPVTGGEQDGQ